MKNIITLFILLITTHVALGQDSLQARIVLVGDAGAFHNGRHPVISAIKQTVKFDKKTTVLFLGDNLYLTGLPDQQSSGYDEARAVLDTQVSIAEGSDAKVYFIAGNHDWNRGHEGGLETVIREQLYIDALGKNKNVKFYPEDGCGGPVEVSVSPDVTMILFDSQWWLYQHEKPGIESDCPYKTQTEILSQMQDIIERNGEKLIIIACHHPFKSYGIHGGYFTLKQHIFPLTEMWPKLYVPLPVIGSIYPIARGVFGTPQDLKHPAYANMIKAVQDVAKGHPNVIFVAGHEHNLQLIKDSSRAYIISGSGTKSTRVSKNKKAPFTSADNGFALLEISKNKNVDVSFYTITDSLRRPYKDHLMSFSKQKIVAADSTKVVTVPKPTSFKDSVVAAVNPRYDTASGVKRFILGNNYRKEWATPVHLKVFNISKEKGGFKIISLGGGKQTKSLRMVDKRDREWTLRMVNKDPEKAVPENLRGSLASDIVQDMISASHPFGPLTIPPMAKALNVVAPSPEYFFVPDDPALGIYREKFSNTVCSLEEREPGSKPGDTKSTAKVIDQLIDDNDNHVAQKDVLNARLLDMLVGDWDRHFDQWRFATADTGKGKLYFPIPRDRDQVFFNSDGLLVKQVSLNLMPYLKGFHKNVSRIDWLNWEARDFDHLFLNNLSQEDWEKALVNFKKKLSDTLIEQAVKKMPAEIFHIRGQEIIQKLKTRRDQLVDHDALKYYNFLSKRVNIVGSNKKEYFRITKADGGIGVKVYKVNKDNDTTSVMYNRVFKDKQTKEINLYGLNDPDKFVVDSDVNSTIMLRIIGGRGNDTFNIKGKIENNIYDLNTEGNLILNSNLSRNKMSSYPSVNEFKIADYRYNIFRFPQLNIGFNQEDKLMLGIGFLTRTYGFRKEPFATQQRLSTLYAINKGSYQLKYNGEFNSVLGTLDLVVNGEMVHPTLNNFFGLGNLTTNTMDKEFYRVRYNYVRGEALVRRRMGGVIQLMVGPQFFNYWNKPYDNRNKILSHPSLVGLDSTNVYATKTYLGGKGAIVINNVNNQLLPTRGIYWVTELNNLYGLNSKSNNLAYYTSDLTLYSSLSDPAKLVAVLKAGGGKILSDRFEYFQAMNLGANNYLRGFRKNRFSGSSLAYGSAELRVKLFESNSYILPGAFGLIGFEEVGRVWMKNEPSRKWHNSYGGGFYFTPYNLVLVSGTVGFSDEETIFNFSIGTKFNITF